jgi:hypothetical protein
MIRTLRALYLGRLLREKLLLLAFFLFAVLIWLSSFNGRGQRFLRAAHTTTTTLKDQTMWLANREAIEGSAQKAASRLDAARTLDGTRLLAEVSNMARDAGLKSTASGETQDVSNGQFAVHSLQFSVSKADWPTFMTFYVALRDRSPYLGIEQFSLVADKANPALLNASLRISSVEIVRN